VRAEHRSADYATLSVILHPTHFTNVLPNAENEGGARTLRVPSPEATIGHSAPSAEDETVYRCPNAWTLLMSIAFAAMSPVSSRAHAQQVLRAEPPPGQLQTGQVVLVDDGSCPQGQIRREVGGAMAGGNARQARGGMARQSQCVPRR